jgi:hypothetical protein
MTTTTELVLKRCEELRQLGYQDAWAGLWTRYPVMRLGKVMPVPWSKLTHAEVEEIEDAYSRWTGG